MSVTIAALTGAAVKAVVPDLARLRMEVFRDWPYLYDGTFDYERAYLADLADSDGAVVVVARDADRIVGAATAAPLQGRHAAKFAAPLAARGYDIGRCFYLGESVLLKSYRGRGIGHAFFDGREAQARALGGFDRATFCAVVRSAAHPMQPTTVAPLDAFWRKRGYAPVAGLVGSFSWLDIGETEETAKPMQYWMKAL